MKKKEYVDYISNNIILEVAYTEKGTVTKTSVAYALAMARAEAPAPEAYADDYAELKDAFELAKKSEESTKLIKEMDKELDEKDEIEEAEHIKLSNDMPSLKRVSMEEANAFLSVKSRTAKTIAYEKLLQEGEYSKEKKEKPSITDAVYTAYWAIATAVYLGYSLSSNNWGQSWVIWVVAGVMFCAVVAITNTFDKKSK